MLFRSRIVDWEFFVNGGDKNDIRYYEAGSGGNMADEISFWDYCRNVEVYMSPEHKVTGEIKNAILLSEPKANPFEDATQSQGYIHCERCGLDYEDDGIPICEHIYEYNDQGEYLYCDTKEIVE